MIIHLLKTDTEKGHTYSDLKILVEKLEEYKKFKLASQDLKDNITYVDDLYYRKKEEIIIDDSMNIVLNCIPHEEIFKAMYDNTIVLKVDLTQPKNKIYEKNYL